MQSKNKLRGIFINPSKANCSIYESGRMMYECLVLSNKYELDYLEVDANNRTVSDQYDFYAFNYHHITMGWLDTRFISKLPGLKLTFVLEVAPNDPFALCPAKDFDVYCALDPTLKSTDKRVYAFPRPLETPEKVTPYNKQPIPVIGSFGFATPGKGFELVVDAVNKEFNEAILRINIPPGTYADDVFSDLHKRNYADYLVELCKKTAKKGIEVKITHDFMTKDALIEWCSQNTLNCFLYDRSMPGLSATTDQAISSGRPLAVSENDTFRHITSYLTAYPKRSLKESIEVSQSEILQIQKDWAPLNFSKKFEEVLAYFGQINASQGRKMNSHVINLKIKRPPKWYHLNLKKIVDKTKVYFKKSYDTP